MGIRRRDFLRVAGAVAASAALAPGRSGAPVSPPVPRDPVRAAMIGGEYPFPYDPRAFDAAERLYNLRRDGRSPAFRARVHLLLRPGVALDVEVRSSDRLETLGSARPQAFSGARDALDVELSGIEGRRHYYQVRYREGTGPWKALSPKGFKVPLESGLDDGFTALVVSDDHTFDDADLEVPPALMPMKRDGDYVNALLRAAVGRPRPDDPAEIDRLKNGALLAGALRWILFEEDPDVVIHLGDATGLGAPYRWRSFGIPLPPLSPAAADAAAAWAWRRMRKIYSGITPIAPLHLCFGNHDGEEAWSPVRAESVRRRRLLFPGPDATTFPEGGHPDGAYYAFSLGSGRTGWGGVRFILLDVQRFAPGGRFPRRPEDWTLGPDQLAWLESLLRQVGPNWSFACMHHVLGGWPAGPEETTFEFAYGRGPLFTADDYVGVADPSRVEQVRLTALARESNLDGFLCGHDHVFQARPIGPTASGRTLFRAVAGSPKYVGERNWWSRPFWVRFYGDARSDPPGFLGPPGIARLTLRRTEAILEYLAVGRTRFTNQPSGVSPGTVLDRFAVARPPQSPPDLRVPRIEPAPFRHPPESSQFLATSASRRRPSR